MTKKVSAHCTASRGAFRLLVRSIVNIVQAYWRFAMASIATEQAASIRHREASKFFPCGAVIHVSRQVAFYFLFSIFYFSFVTIIDGLRQAGLPMANEK